jgi:hypothetical protein
MTAAPADPRDPAPLEPPRPEDYECCGNGCEPCVFDLHAQAVERWRTEMKAWRERQAARPAAHAAEPQAAEPGVEPAAAVPALFRPASPH